MSTEIRIWKKTYKKDDMAVTTSIDVLIRNIGKIWEYMFVWQGKIYSAHIEVKIPFWRKFQKEKYKDEEIKGIINLVFTMGKTTVDELNKEENEKK